MINNKQVKNRRREKLQPIKYVDKSNLLSVPVSNNYNMESYHNKLKLNLVNTQSINIKGIIKTI